MKNWIGMLAQADKEWETLPHASCIKCRAEFVVMDNKIPEHPEVCKIIQRGPEVI